MPWSTCAYNVLRRAAFPHVLSSQSFNCGVISNWTVKRGDIKSPAFSHQSMGHTSKTYVWPGLCHVEFFSANRKPNRK